MMYLTRGDIMSDNLYKVIEIDNDITDKLLCGDK